MSTTIYSGVNYHWLMKKGRKTRKPVQRLDQGFRDRLKDAMLRAANTRAPGLAAKVGAEPATIYKYLGGQSQSIDAFMLFRIATVLNCNPLWLLTGEGLMEPPHSPTAEEAQAIALFRRLSPQNRELWLEQGESLYKRQAPAAPSTADPFPNASR